MAPLSRLCSSGKHLLLQRLGKHVRIAGILVTRYDGRRTLARAMAVAATRFRLPVFRTLIRENVQLAEAPSRGCDIFTYAPSAAGAEDYLDLAKEYLSR